MTHHGTTPPLRETPAAFARRIGVSRQRVNTMLAQGLPRGRDLLIPVAEAMEWINRHLDPARSFGQRRAVRREKHRSSCACPSCGRPTRPSPPPGFTALERVSDRFEQGCLLMYLLLIYRVPALVAWAVAEAGGSMDLVFKAAQNAPLMFMIEMEEQAGEAGLSWMAAEGGEGPPLYHPAAFLPVDWHRLRTQAGEPDWEPPLSIPGWRQPERDAEDNAGMKSGRV